MRPAHPESCYHRHDDQHRAQHHADRHSRTVPVRDHTMRRARANRTADPSPGDLSLLVGRAQKGDHQAFEALYRRCIGRVYALCLRLAGDPAEADELAQEAFVRAWRKLPSFRGDSAFGSWLHRLTTNVVFERWRSEGRQRDRVVAIGDSQQLDHAEESPSPRVALDLERAIASLPTGARTVFVLHDIEGHRHREIAELTGLAEGTSKAQLHRARKLLRERLKS